MTWTTKVLNWLDPKRTSKDVALVLSTGGARGLAHIGAIQELSRQGYNIHSVTGTSMGAIVGGFYAAGRLDDFIEFMSHIDRRRILQLTDFTFSLSHLAKGYKVFEAMRQIIPDMNIEDLNIPYRAIACDCITGKEVVFSHGSLYRAMRASASLPVYFSPMEFGDKLLLDGGLVNPLPLDRAVRTKNDLLVAVNVSGHDYKGQMVLKKMIQHREQTGASPMALIRRFLPNNDENSLNYIALVNRTISIMINQNTQRSLRLTPPDLLVDIPLNRYSTFDFDKSERLIAIGEKKTQRALQLFDEKRGISPTISLREGK